MIPHALIPSGHTKPIGKYSPGIRLPMPGGSLIFISGQVACDEHGKTLGVGDAEEQTKVVFDNLCKVLAAAGADLSHLVSVTIYLTDMKHFEGVSRVRNRVMPDPAPASTLLEVSRLAIADHLVEISAIAWVREGVEAR